MVTQKQNHVSYRLRVGHVGLDEGRLAPVGLDERDRVRSLLLAPGRQHNAGAVAGEAPGGGQAEAVVSAGDERYLPVEAAVRGHRTGAVAGTAPTERRPSRKCSCDASLPSSSRFTRR